MIVINRGGRKFDLKDGKDANGNPVKRVLLAGGSIETIDEEEAKTLLSYHEVEDAAKVVPMATDKIKVLTEERDALKSRVAELEGKVAQLEGDAVSNVPAKDKKHVEEEVKKKK